MLKQSSNGALDEPWTFATQRGLVQSQSFGGVVASRAVVIAIVALSTLVTAQPHPQFEVASIKRWESSSRGLAVGPAGRPRALPGGVFSATAATVEQLLTFSYQLREYQIVGGPDWIRRDRFEVNGRARENVSGDAVKLMVQSLLQDRFGMRAHRENREMRYHALVRARPNGALGPSIESVESCSPAAIDGIRAKFPEKHPVPIGSGILGICSPQGVDLLADVLSSAQDGVPVIDDSGLKGSFYGTLRSQFNPGALSRGVIVGDPSLPSLPTALEQQFGLRLESRKGPREVLVVDAVQLPTEN